MSRAMKDVMRDLPVGRAAATALIAVCGLLAFAISIEPLGMHSSCGNSFHFDDEHSILQNPHVRSLGNIPSFFADPGTFSGLPQARMYRPLVVTTYALNYGVNRALGLDGYQVAGYHLLNLLLHLLCAWLVWELGCLVLRDRLAALFGGLVFVAHPLMTEPVNYVSSRSSLLAAAFYLGGFWLLVRARQKRADGPTGAWTGLLSAAGLASKSIAITWPLAAGLYLVLTGQRRRWRLLLPSALVGALYLVLTRSIVGKALLEPVRSLSIQGATQIKALVYYLWKTAMPVGLSVEPQFRAATSPGDAPVALAGLLVLSLGILGVRGRRRRPLLVLGAGWYFLTLLPTLLVPLNILVSEHRLYLPLVGAALLLGRLLQGSRYRVRTVWALVLLAFVVHCGQRNRVWRDDEALWSDAVARGPGMGRSWVNLGKAYLEQGRTQEAISASRRALDIDPHQARAHYNIGTAFLHQGEPEVAAAHYTRSLEIQPDLIEAHNNLGNAYHEQGRLPQALEAYRRALAVHPQASIYHNLGKVFLDQGRPDSAAVAFGRALDLDPALRESYKGMVQACRAEERLQTALQFVHQALEQWPNDPAYWRLAGDLRAALGQEESAIRAYARAGQDPGAASLSLGDAALQRGDWARAREHYEEARHLGLDDARIHNGLGETWFGQGDAARALAAFREAARRQPRDAAAYAGIGRTYLKYGGPLEAVAALERAAELDPGHGGYRALLGDALGRSGKPDLAIAAYREAIRVAPAKAEFHHNLGLLCQRAGHLAEAEQRYRAALERDPRLAGSHYNLGNLYLDQGRRSAAAAAYEQALGLQPDHADAWLNLATVRLDLGDADRAAACYQRFLQVYPRDDALRDGVRRQLAELLPGEQPER